MYMYTENQCKHRFQSFLEPIKGLKNFEIHFEAKQTLQLSAKRNFQSFFFEYLTFIKSFAITSVLNRHSLKQPFRIDGPMQSYTV